MAGGDGSRRSRAVDRERNQFVDGFGVGKVAFPDADDQVAVKLVVRISVSGRQVRGGGDRVWFGAVETVDPLVLETGGDDDPVADCVGSSAVFVRPGA